MRILGLNFSIDAAAALVVDGALVAAACEERFDRRVHSRAFPRAAIASCLDHAGITLDQVDAVASFWNPALQLDAVGHAWLASYRHHAEYLFQVPAQLAALGADLAGSRYVATELDRGSRRPPLRVFHVAHHLCHAALAWRLSGWDEAALLTLDGYGERASGILARGGPGGIEVLHELAFPHSLGSVYAAVTEHLGFAPNADEGKVMGLAAYGTPRMRDALGRIVRATPEGIEVDLAWFDYYLPRPRRVSARFVREFGPPRAPQDPIGDRDRDLAASLQAVLSERLLHLARLLHERTGLSRLAYAGGVALNSLANGDLVRSGPFREVFIPPAAGDAGTAAGAALWVHEHLGGAPAPAPGTDALGPDVGVSTLERDLATSGFAFTRPADIAAHAAERVAGGAIIGWFQGRMEFGPRALGQRSLIGDPRTMATFERLNREIKFREPFRPYAPAVLAERVGDYFAPAMSCPYMLVVLDVLERAKALLPAITHADGTARVQTVDARTNPLFHRLIAEFGRHTGIPVVLNTSFNVRGQPIVCRPAEALAMLATTRLDGLAIGPFWVEGRRA